jgi:hypothetical protein
MRVLVVYDFRYHPEALSPEAGLSPQTEYNEKFKSDSPHSYVVSDEDRF